MVLIQESTLTGIADAIRSKLGITSRLQPTAFAVAIHRIPQTLTGFDMNITGISYDSVTDMNIGAITQDYNDMALFITEDN